MSNSPFGKNPSSAAMIDQRLGVAYFKVEQVADALDTIKAVAANIPAIQQAATGVNLNTVIVEAGAGATGAVIPLPGDVRNTDIVDSKVVVEAADGAISTLQQGEFSMAILPNDAGLQVNLIGSGLAKLTNGTIRWTLTYNK